jgi:zinc transporter
MSAKAKKFAFALLLDGKGGARELSDEEVGTWKSGDGILWVDLDLGSKPGRKWLTKESGIDANAVAILLAGETRPRSLLHGEGLLAVVRGINMNPGAQPDDMVAVRMLLQRERIVTTRRRTVLSVRDVRDRLLAGTGPKTPGQFLTDLTSCLAGRIEAAVENVENMLEELGEQVSTGDIEVARSKLGIVRRQAASIRRHLAPQRDAIDRLARNQGGLLTDSEAFDLREEGDHLARHIEDLDLARENALVAQEELMNRIAMEQNARMYLLSVVAAVFLPLTFVTGMLGMNVAGLPGTVNPNGFLISAVIMVGLGVALIAYFRWKKWI